MRATSCIMLAAFGCASASGQVPCDETKPAVGVWHGFLQPGDAFCQVVIESDDGAWSVKGTLLPVGALDAAAHEIVIDGRSVAFTLPGAVTLGFAGTVSEDGQIFAGTASGPAQTTFEMTRSQRPTDLPEPFAFTGTIAGMIEMTLVLAPTPRGDWVGHLDVPMQSLRGYPVIDIAESDDRFTASLPVPGGASIDFELDALRTHLTGTFTQGGRAFEMQFERDVDDAFRELARPQHPEPPFPYVVREESAPHPKGFSIAGTLTVPPAATHGPGPYPCAVLISGSGQQDRDETIFGHKPFLVIADHLTRNGIAVMRYDDRGVGASQVADLSLVTEATSVDNASDTAAVVAHLRTLDEIDDKRIGLVGHSEGGMIAPMVCRDDSDIAFAVLLAGPGVRGGDLLVKQLSFGWAQGADDATTERLLPLLERVVELVGRGGTTEQIRAGVEKLVAAQDAEGLAGGADRVAMVQAAMSLLDNNWMRYFVNYDPSENLAAMACPVLAANGTLDLQVWHEQNLDAIERIMTDAGRDVTIKRYENLNHLFQPAVTGAGAEYASIETTFDEQVLADMSAWIQKKVTRD